MNYPTTNSKHVKELFTQALEEIVKPAPSVKIPEWNSFTKATRGFRPREYSIFCGGTGIGKTTWIANLSASLLLQQVPQFVASVETGYTDFIKRVISVLIKQDVNTGDPVDLSKLAPQISAITGLIKNSNLFLSLYENRFSVETLMEEIEYHVLHYGVKIAIIDNLNFFMEVTSAKDSIVEMDRVIHELIIFCKRVDVHIVMVQHPKKTDDGRVESEFDVKGSSTCVQEAHNVFLYNRCKRSDVEAGTFKSTDRELTIAKMRRGGRYVGDKIYFDGESGVVLNEIGLVQANKPKTETRKVYRPYGKTIYGND